MRIESALLANRALRQAREKRGLTQEQLAEALGTTHHSVYRWEKGSAFPGLFFRQKLCAFFGQDAEALGLQRTLETDAAADEMVVPTSTSVRSIFPPITPLGEALAGRRPLLESLTRRLSASGKTVISRLALQGIPGMGKTALAVEMAFYPAITQHYPDGLLWASVGQSPDLLMLLSLWASRLGLSAESLSPYTTVAQLKDMLAEHLAEKRYLLILDDIWRLEDALNLTIGGPCCTHVLTTRFPQLAYQYAPQQVIPVPELDHMASLSIIQTLAPVAVEQSFAEVAELLQVVGGLPLTLVLIGHALARVSYSHQPRRILGLLRRLLQSEARMELEAALPKLMPEHNGATSLQATIASSVQILPQAVQAALSQLAIFPAKPLTFPEHAAQAVCGCDDATVVDLLDTLTDVGLVEGVAPERYTLHQAIIDYASLPERDSQACRRLIIHMVTWWETHQEEPLVVAQEWPLMQYALDLSLQTGFSEWFVQGVLAISTFLQTQGFYAVLLSYTRSALTHAERSTPYLIRLLLIQAHLLIEQGEYGQAEHFAEQACQKARECEHSELLAACLDMLGFLAFKQSRFEQAQCLFEEGWSQQSTPQIQGSLLLHLSHLQLHYGRNAEAQATAEKGLDLVGDGLPIQRCELLNMLGTIVMYTGQFDRAEEIYTRGLELAQQMGYSVLVTLFRFNLTSIEQRRGHVSAHIPLFQQQLKEARELGRSEAMIKILDHLAFAYCEIRNFAQADTCLREALALATSLGNREQQTRVLANLGSMFMLQGDLVRAEEYTHKALELARALEMRGQIAVLLLNLGELTCKGQRFKEAREALLEALPYASESQTLVCLAPIHLELSRVYAGQEEPDQALQEAQEALRCAAQWNDEPTRAEIQQWLESLPVPPTA